MKFTSKADLRHILILSFGIFISNVGFSQIFEETFNEGNGQTNGFDDQGGVAWTSSCTGCVAGDHWEIVNGMFENQDSNGPAVWETTADIDISTCTNFNITFDIEEDDELEGCGTGCNSVDWVQLEYNIDKHWMANTGKR